MARKDELTGKGPLSGNKRSHAMNHSKRKWNVNLQNVKIYDEKGNITSVKISTRTLKTLKKHNRVATFNPVNQVKSKN
ncbi:MAG: 50S ribosomal protein L28 [Mycoplasmoidaceae bacterium]